MFGEKIVMLFAKTLWKLFLFGGVLSVVGNFPLLGNSGY